MRVAIKKHREVRGEREFASRVCWCLSCGSVQRERERQGGRCNKVCVFVNGKGQRKYEAGWYVGAI